MFKQPRAENYGIEAFTRNGFKSWKDGPKVFNQHVGKHDSAHNKSRQHYEDFKNQRQNLSHVFDRGSQKQEEEYKARLLIILGIVNFLILQALAFRGHDESTSSMNKGNFKELLDLFIKKDPKVITHIKVFCLILHVSFHILHLSLISFACYIMH
ncbi:unnamed protein product [Triticum turgidum subsp. durum]|uniref:DUF4371 domain-containing protein n=1 Tax=Triticum turgidum subsp. durum TaxID=4567 RepID=A0A9R1RMT1_TRITD|nr:unnamed protein product [Triticum turgidum subsp. durum]